MSSKRKELLMPVVCAVAIGIYLICMSGKRALNCDDMAVIHITMPGLTLSEMFQRLFVLDIQPPLVAIIEGVWIRLVPVSYTLYKVPSIIAISIAGYLLCRLSYRYAGIIACILMGVMIPLSDCIFYEGAFSMRPYGFLFLMTCWSIYMFNEVNQKVYKEEKVKASSWFAFGLSLLFLVYTHYFGIFVFFCLGAAEIIVTIKKRRIVCLLPFLISGICFLPWAFGVMLPAVGMHETFWPPIPDLHSIGELIFYMCGWNGIGIVVLAVSVIVIGYRMIVSHHYRQSYEGFWVRTLWFIIIVSVGIPYFYSKYGNSAASVWVHRYFIIIMPSLLLTIILGTKTLQKSILEVIRKNKNISIKKTIFKYGIDFVLIFMLIITQSVKNKDAVEEPYESAIQYLHDCEDINDETTLLTSIFSFYDGFNFIYSDGQKYGYKRACGLTEIVKDNIEQYQKIYVLTEFYSCDDEILQYVKNIIGDEYEVIDVQEGIAVLSSITFAN